MDDPQIAELRVEEPATVRVTVTRRESGSAVVEVRVVRDSEVAQS